MRLVQTNYIMVNGKGINKEFNMIDFKKYIANEFVGKRLHFKCDCIFPLDHVGVIKDYDIIKNEIVFTVDIDGKLIQIGENHPNLQVIAM